MISLFLLFDSAENDWIFLSFQYFFFAIFASTMHGIIYVTKTKKWWKSCIKSLWYLEFRYWISFIRLYELFKWVQLLWAIWKKYEKVFACQSKRRAGRHAMKWFWQCIKCARTSVENFEAKINRNENGIEKA